MTVDVGKSHSVDIYRLIVQFLILILSEFVLCGAKGCKAFGTAADDSPPHDIISFHYIMTE